MKGERFAALAQRGPKPMKKLTPKQLHRRIMSGKATRAQILRGLRIKFDALRARRQKNGEKSMFAESNHEH